MSEKRTCRKCNIEKEFNITNFRNNLGKPEGKTCRDCYNKSRINHDRNRYKNEKEKRQSMMKKWRKNNPKKVKELRNKWRKSKNGKEYNRKYKILRRSKDPKFKLNCNFSRLINLHLHKKGGKKGHKWENIVGYTIDDLKSHLESLFEPWMNWDNYGNPNGDHTDCWHIDHIVPKSWFNYTSYEDEEFKKCWALSNLQPKEGKANITKNNNYIG
jgi:hypothetical protein